MGNPEFGLEGKGALVVGGGSGIGRETSLLLGRVGANVAVADLDAGRADAVRAEVAETGVQATSIGGDVTNPSGADTVVATAREQLGRLDVVINIVGLASWSSILDLDPETAELFLHRNAERVFALPQEHRP